MMDRLRFRNEGHYLVGVGILGEAGVVVHPRGGNEVDVVADGWADRLNDEQRAELVKLVRDPIAYTDAEGNQVVQASPDGMVAELAAAEGESGQPLPAAGDGATEHEAEAVTPPVAAEGTQGQAVAWVGEQPPRTGPGSGRDAWAAFADDNKISYPADAGRDDIIRAVEAHGGS